MSVVTSQQNVTRFMRTQYEMSHGWLEATLGEVASAELSYQPAGVATSIAAQYAHIVTSEDFFINAVLKGGAPVMAAGNTGLSEMPPPDTNWGDWARRVQVDLAAARAYGQTVYAATDAYLSSITDDDLGRAIDLTNMGLGPQTVGSLLNILLINANNHCGEISTVKGLQGLKGYPA